MAAPILTLASTPTAASFNATTLTGGPAGGLSVLGYTGADFYLMNAALLQNGRRKLQGGEQLLPTLLGTPTIGTNVLNTISWTPADEYQLSTDTPKNNSLVLNCNTGDGLKYDQIVADQYLRKFFWYGKTGSAAAFRMTATLSDSSVAPQTYTIPVTTNQGVLCTFRAKEANSTLEIKIESLGGTTHNAFVFSQFVYLAVPVAPPRPRGLQNLVAYKGQFGGANL